MVCMNRYKGFTLIELVVVIVILGILAVVAMPKFLNLQRDARIADLKGAEGALKSANGIVYGKAAIKGVANLEYNNFNNSNDSNLIVDGRRVDLHYGYIKASKWNIQTIMNLSSDDWNIKGTSGLFGKVYMTPKGAPGFKAADVNGIEQSKCYLAYYFTKQNYTIPTYELETDGC